MPARLDLLFATPLIVDELEEAAALNEALERLILERQAADGGVQRSNLGGWHSDMNLLEWAREPVTPVVRRVIELADAATLDTQAASGHRRGWLLEAWANVNSPGAANLAHSHGGCYWSAVYYVRVDEGEGGELVLNDPRMPAIDMHAPALRFRGAEPEQQALIQPRPGMIVIFPSWLTHSVNPWAGEGRRISIAINLSAPAMVAP